METLDGVDMEMVSMNLPAEPKRSLLNLVRQGEQLNRRFFSKRTWGIGPFLRKKSVEGLLTYNPPSAKPYPPTFCPYRLTPKRPLRKASQR